ncbi:hypothetical protein SAV14893_088880 [Streptomyces avermitilis]|uniref:AMP-dependent synthetase/ligase domain-containing protein n=1 Tax=Streptomyces avermitilis TaxID=33903 RepID=A0A4D4MCB7_STRAX|nr:hypothetical protein SAV14893_088880 [Streptomyces avermitilis]
MAMDRLHHPELQTLVQTTSFHARNQPTTPAVLFEGRTVTYEQLHRESNRIAHAVQAAGLTPGDRVAYLGKESEHYYEILFGCAKSGTVLVPVNWRLTAPEVSHILRDSGTRLLFLEEEFGPIVEKMPTAPPETVVGLGEPFVAWKASHPDTDPTPHVTPTPPSPSSTPAAPPDCPRASSSPTAASSRSVTRWRARGWTGSTGAQATSR